MKTRTVFCDFEIVDTRESVQMIRDRIVEAFRERMQGSDCGAPQQINLNVADAMKPKKGKPR